MSTKGKIYLAALAGVLLMLCCLLSMCAAQFLPNPQTQPAAWTAMSEVAASSRLFGFLAALTSGSICNWFAVLLIPVLLAFILWRGRPGA